LLCFIRELTRQPKATPHQNAASFASYPRHSAILNAQDCAVTCTCGYSNLGCALKCGHIVIRAENSICNLNRQVHEKIHPLSSEYGVCPNMNLNVQVTRGTASYCLAQSAHADHLSIFDAPRYIYFYLLASAQNALPPAGGTNFLGPFAQAVTGSAWTLNGKITEECPARFLEC